MPITNENQNVVQDLLGPREDPNKAVEQNRAIADQLSTWEKIGAGAAVSGPGAFINQMMDSAKRSLNDEDKYDAAFAAGVPERITADFPDATDNELSFLAENGMNQKAYDAAVKYVLDQRKTNAILEYTTIGQASKLFTDVAPEIIVGAGIEGITARMAVGGKRVATAVGLNAAAGAAYEYKRQQLALEQSDGSSVALSGLLSGVVGGVFDGLTAAQRAQAIKGLSDKIPAGFRPASVLQAFKGMYGKIVRRGKPVIEEAADDAAKAADNVAPEAAVAKQADAAPQPVNILDDAAPAVAKQADEVLPAVDNTVTKAADALDPVANLVKSFADELEAQVDTTGVARQVIEEAPASTQNYLKAADELDQAPVSQATEAVVAQEAKAADGATPVKVADAPTAKAESVLPEALAKAKLKIDDVGRTFRPTFTDPVDKALAIVGSHSNPELSVQALETLRGVFKGQTDDTIRAMASDFVDNHMMPALRSSKNGVRKLPTWAGKANPEEYLPVADQVAKLAPANELKAYAETAEVTAAHLTRHADDVDGSLLEAATKEANKLVTADEVANGFAELAKKRKTLAQTVAAKVEDYKVAHGAEPSVHQVRQMMANELYGRKLFNASRAKTEDAAFDEFMGLVGSVTGFSMLRSKKLYERAGFNTAFTKDELAELSKLKAAVADRVSHATFIDAVNKTLRKHADSAEAKRAADTAIEDHVRAVEAWKNRSVIPVSVDEVSAGGDWATHTGWEVKPYTITGKARRYEVTVSSKHGFNVARESARSADEAAAIIKSHLAEIPYPLPHGTINSIVTKQSGFITPKMAIMLGTATVASLFIADNAEAGTGGVVGEASVLLAGMAIVFGGKGMFKALAAAKLLTPALRKAGTKAERMLQDGVDPDIIKKTTGFEVRNGELVLPVPKGDVKALLDTSGELSAEALDDLAERMEGFTPRGTPLKAVLSFDAESWAKEAAAGHLGAGYLKVTIPGTDRVIEIPNTFRALRSRSIRVEDSKSPTARMVGRMYNSNLVSREGFVANEMTVDAVWRQEQANLLNQMEHEVRLRLNERYTELGQRKPAFYKVAERELDMQMFREEITRYRQNPSDTTISEAAKKASRKQFELESAVIQKMKNLAAEYERAGIVLPEGHPLRAAAELSPDEFYVSRVVDKDKMHKLVAMEGVGVKGIQEVIQEAFGRANPDVPKALLPDIAARVYRTLSGVADQRSLFLSKGKSADLAKELEEAGFDKDVSERVVGFFAEHEPGALPTQLKKRRMALDMSTKKTFDTPNGPVTVSIGDIYKSDALDLFSKWSHSLLGIYSHAVVGLRNNIDLLDESVRSSLRSRMIDEGAESFEMDLLDATSDYVLGRGRDERFFGAPESFERTASALGNFTLGQNFLLSMAGDIGASVAMMLRARKYVNGFETLRDGVASGALSKEELKQLDGMMTHMTRPAPSVASASDGTFESVAANRAERMVFWQNKLNVMNWAKRQVALAVTAGMQHELLNYALTGKLSDERLWKHFAALGIDKKIADEIAPLMRATMKKDAETGAFIGFDFEKWDAMSPSTREVYVQAIRKLAASSNAEATGFGETSPWLTSTVAGRQFGKLTSSVQIVNQKLQRDAAIRDGIVALNWFNSFTLSVAQHIVKTGLYYGGDSAEMEKRLTYQQLAWAGIRNGAMGGLWTTALDSGLSLTGLMPGGISAMVVNRSSDSGFELATLSGLRNYQTTAKALVGIVSGNPYDVLTRQEVMAAQRSFAPLLAIGAATSYLSKDMATKNPKRPAETPDASPFN